jgi:hypothetical protein
MVEGITGVALTSLQRSTIIKGASELELVNSGLEDTMIRSYHEIREIYKNNPKVEHLAQRSHGRRYQQNSGIIPKPWRLAVISLRSSQ